MRFSWMLICASRLGRINNFHGLKKKLGIPRVHLFSRVDQVHSLRARSKDRKRGRRYRFPRRRGRCTACKNKHVDMYFRKKKKKNSFKTATWLFTLMQKSAITRACTRIEQICELFVSIFVCLTLFTSCKYCTNKTIY